MINWILRENKMRILILVLLFILDFTLIFNQVKKSSAEKEPFNSVQEKHGKSTKSAIQKTKKLKGTLLAMDLITNRIVVKSKKSLDTLHITNTTVIKTNGKNVKLSALVKNRNISIIYKKENAKKIATFINQILPKTPVKNKKIKEISNQNNQ